MLVQQLIFNLGKRGFVGELCVYWSVFDFCDQGRCGNGLGSTCHFRAPMTDYSKFVRRKCFFCVPTDGL